jgi:hypothetical protein
LGRKFAVEGEILEAFRGLRKERLGVIKHVCRGSLSDLGHDDRSWTAMEDERCGVQGLNGSNFEAVDNVVMGRPLVDREPRWRRGGDWLRLNGSKCKVVELVGQG